MVTAPAAVWTPAAAPVTMPLPYPDHFAVHVWNQEGGMRLVGAVELVSPGNKDRDLKRRAFAVKCASYLVQGIGLVLVDVVTTRSHNLHNEIVELLRLDPSFRIGGDGGLYAVAYRPLHREARDEADHWPVELRLGEPLPQMPLSLAADLCVPVDLEAAYRDASRRHSLNELFDEPEEA